MIKTAVIGMATLYLADCREILSTLSANALVTDPPYGIKYSTGTTNLRRAKGAYAGAFDDSREYVRDVCVPAVETALARCGGRGAITPGAPCLWLYPEPAVIGGLYQPCAVGLNRWGFSNFNPVCFYGKDPRAGKHLSKTVLSVTEPPSDDRHPCAKPQKVADWLVEKCSLPDETVMDIFMGSGTTGVAAVSLGRKFIGIELEPQYFEIACERIDQAQRQSRIA